jgi:hypothetical protein
MDTTDAERLGSDLLWSTMHPDPIVRAARARMLEAHELLAEAAAIARHAELELRRVDPEHPARAARLH